jgi:hypothetical protein
MARLAGAVLGMLVLAHAAAAQFTQQGSKLVAADALGAANQGWSVALSADGNTAIVGGPHDHSFVGATWVYTRSAGVWSQQGSKLVGTGAVGPANQGYSVAISSDGNTAIVGGFGDNSIAGAAWVYTRSGGVWTQQGSKLVSSDTFGNRAQGLSVAISADGNTAIVGGQQGNADDGAAWVWTRSGEVWSQQGSKLVSSGAVSGGEQGILVAISADGNTAILGGPNDSPNGNASSAAGAAWVWTRSGGVWMQQGGKLVGTGAVGNAEQGSSVALSADGNTAIVGGPNDNSDAGAAWVWTRSGGVWSQQGNKLVGTGAYPNAAQGWSVAISADGNTAIVGGPGEDAVWVYTRSAGVWSQEGGILVGSGAVGAAAQGTSVAISSDGSTVLVGGPNDNSNAGAAWVFSVPGFAAWVPVASHNPGLNQSQWRSDLGLLNTGSVTADVQLSFYGSGGVMGGPVYVPAGAQSILTDVVAQIGGSGSGAVQIVSDQPLKVTARSYNQVSPTAGCYANGTQGQDYPVLTASGGLGVGQSAYLGGLTENASYRCNIGLVNTGMGNVTVLVELFDGAGNKLTSYTVGLTAGQWAQETQPFKLRAGQAAMDRGYARLTVQSGSGVFGFASVIDNITNDPTTVAMQQ